MGSFLPRWAPWQQNRTDHYQHESLDASQDAIRLFQIVYDEVEQVSCRIQTYNLEECPPFTAVSYAWGPPHPQDTILVNGSPFGIRRGLHEFLVSIKDGVTPFEDGKVKVRSAAVSEARKEMYLWCDQLCIDQTNVRERNHQVALMSQIYSAAAETIIWLGARNDDDHFAFGFLGNRLLKPANGQLWRRSVPNMQRLEGVGEWAAADMGDGWLSEPEMEEVTRLSRHLKSTQLEAAKLATLKAAVQCPYWSRLWIVQEIWFSKSLNIVHGRQIIPWKSLEAFVKPELAYLDDYGDFLPSSVATAREEIPLIVYDLFNDKDAFKNGEQRLSYIIETFGNQLCEDPKDKVFGLLGLVAAEKRVVVDYSLEVEELFQHVVAKVIQDEANLALDTHLNFAMMLAKMLRGQSRTASVDAWAVEHFVKQVRENTKKAF
jgi:hypothetical protein